MRWTLSIKYGLQSINFWEFWFPKKSIFSNWFLKQISISGDQSFHSKINIKIQKNQYNNQNKMKFKNQYPINHTNFQICMGSVAAPCFPCRISGFILFTHDLFQGVVSCWSYVHMTFFKVLGLADPMYTWPFSRCWVLLILCTRDLFQGAGSCWYLLSRFWMQLCPFSRINVYTSFLHPLSCQQEVKQYSVFRSYLKLQASTFLS